MPTEGDSLKVLLSRLLREVSSWKSGDLVVLAAIQEGLASLAACPEFAKMPARSRKAFKAIAEGAKGLLDPGKEEDWLRSFGEWAGKAAPALSDAAEAEVAAPPVEPSSHYGPDYFANIIEDQKMLSQLCEEVKEHLDNAQFSLVDLEYDPLNPEHINKVFRAFHTIKSSAAFLGFKNIEEVSHSMEDLLVLVRDGKLPMSGELTDVIFYGIKLLKALALVIEDSGYSAPAMVESFKLIDIVSYLNILKKVLSGYAGKRIGEILVEDGKLDRATVDQILEHQKLNQRKFGEIAVEEKLVSEEDFRAALAKQESAAPPQRKSSYVKVSNERLNALIDIVGELVVNQSMLRQELRSSAATSEACDRTVAQLESITTSIKNIVLTMGMVPIAEIFNKLRVVARNTAADLAKTVTVEFSGEDTELDRNVIETIYDPLVHIVRNAVDHGIEEQAEREAAGKPPVAKVLIAAEHKGNSIEVSVADDGKGIDPERVLAKAVERGLVPADQASSLTEREIYSFLFLPGFSTAKKVTEISGRGVGLDVVKKNIDQIHGKVDILSEPGKGSRFVIRIPLTLAIIDGFVTEVDDSKYVFPFTLIEEIIVPQAGMASRLDDGKYLLRNRDQFIPLIFASEVFGHEPGPEGPEGKLGGKVVIVISHERRRYGIVVDATAGKQEIVIKSLSEALRRVRVFSGGTIFGDGSIGFVVDIEEFLSKAREGEQ